MSDNSEILRKASRVKLAVFDVDGVLTNGGIILSATGEEHKVFHAHDGLGLVMLKRSGCEIAIISSRTSKIVTNRMADLGIIHVYQGQADKRTAMLAILSELNIEKADAAYTGDDLVDIPAMKQSGFAIAVANAHALVKKQADWTTENCAGAGAVREVCELILRAQGKLDSIFNEYLR